VHVDAEAKNFGFVFGACDELKSVYALHLDLNEGLLKLALLSDWNSPTASYEVQNAVPLSIAEDGEYNIEVVIERSVVVIYVNGQTAMTNRVYKMHQNPWMIFSDTGQVVFSDLVVSTAG
jgi:beta-fructofuranosidase